MEERIEGVSKKMLQIRGGDSAVRRIVIISVTFYYIKKYDH